MHMTRDFVITNIDCILSMRSDEIIPFWIYDKPFTYLEQFDGTLPNPDTGIIWFTGGSSNDVGTGAGVYCQNTEDKFSFSLGDYCTGIQSEIYAILACVKENLDRNYKGKNIYILAVSRSALRSLHSRQICSGLVVNCLQYLSELAEHNKITLLWVPGHSNLEGNVIAHSLAKNGANSLFIGPEPAFGLTFHMSKLALRFWSAEITELRQPSQLSARNYQRILGHIKELYLGQCHLNNHFYLTKRMTCPICGRCRESEKPASSLCLCEPFSKEKLNYLWSLHPNDFQKMPIFKLLSFAKSIKTTAGVKKEESK